MIALQQLKERLPKSPKGQSCIFVKIDNEIGIKVYRHKSIRDGCFALQQKLSEKDLAPKAYEKLEIGEYYCYTTEVAEVWYHQNKWIIGTDEDHKKFYDDMEKLQAELYDVFFMYHLDDCEFNYGYIVRNNRKILVFIDTEADCFRERYEYDSEDQD